MPAQDMMPLSWLVLALRLAGQTEKHVRMTRQNIERTGALDYNFCFNHEKIETKIADILSNLFSSLADPENELGVLTTLVVLGARISLYKAAIVNSQKAEFLSPVISECQRISLATASEMCDVLLQVNALRDDKVSHQLLTALAQP